MQTKATDGTTLTVTPAILPSAVELNVSTRVIAEWNQNRYAGISQVYNGVGTQQWSNYFKLSSIVDPFRPTSKVAIAITDIAVSDDDYTNVQYLTVDDNAKYTYWVSNDASAGTPVSGTYPISNVQPTVLYAKQLWTNKITATFDVTSAANNVALYTVDVTSNGGSNWTTVATNPTIDPITGMFTIYRQANGTWSSTVYRDNPTQINGIRLTVTAMASANKRVNLIELSPKLESDLSIFVSEYEVDASMSETSFVTPLGIPSGNSGSVTLSNIDGRFSNDNAGLYNGILDKNVKITIDSGVKEGFAGTGYEWVRQATMLADVWGGQDLESTTVRLQDDSQYLQTVDAPYLYLENIAPGAAIVSILNAIGYSSYNYTPSEDEIKIPYFWCGGEDEKVWDVISKIAQPLQMAFFFDEYGVLQIKPANAAYNAAATSVWTLAGRDVTGKYADIIDLNKTADYEGNVVNVEYKKSHLSSSKYGYPAMETVWEPEGTVALRGRRLAKTFTNTDTVLWLHKADAEIWPYSGMVRVENEYVEFDGKSLQVVYTNNTTAQVWVTSQEQYDSIKNQSDVVALTTSFDGRLQVVKRGLFNSVVATHNVGNLTSRWTGTYGSFDWPREVPRLWNGPMNLNPNTGKVRVTTNNQFNWHTWFTMRAGAVANPIKTFASTRLRFPSYDPGDVEKTSEPYTVGLGGIALNLTDTNDYGWYIDLCASEAIDTIPGMRQWTHELALVHRPATGGPVMRFSPGASVLGQGVQMTIAKDKWYTLDVLCFSTGPVTSWTIWLDGIAVFNATTPLASYSGRWGLHARGYSVVDFEYAMSTNGGNMILPPDYPSFISAIHGGTQSQVLSNHVFTNWADPVGQPLYVDSYTPEAVRRADLFYDEFSPSVNELREYDVKFTKTPVVHSRPFLTNDDGVMIPEYTPNPFGAHFYILNNNRDDAILNGEDSSIDINNTVQQKMLIYGRLVIQDDVKTVTVRNEAAIRRRGEVSVSITSPFIQSESTAKVIANFITTQWSGGQDEVSVESFYNPLLQIGDKVGVDYPVENMSITTHKYFVVGIQRGMSDEGPTTRLKLRRVRG